MTYRLPITLTALCLAMLVREAGAQQAPSTESPPQQPQQAADGQVQPASNQVQAVGGQFVPLAVGGQLNQQAAPLTSPPTAAPFQLNEIEQQLAMQTLQMWQQKSAEITTFNSDFERWEYDAVFGPGAETPLIKSTGSLSFSKPDKGSFKIESISRWTKKDPQDTGADSPGDWQPQPHEVGEHWVCDGKAVYEYNHRDKQLVVTTIPEQMRGQSIVDGPLPFLFGADANKLVDRYWIRTKQSDPAEIWLEAYPKRQSDAANYDRVDVMLDRKTMQPTALQVHLPGGQQRHVYMFKDPKVNEKNLGTWFTGLFSAPRTPLGWTRVKAEEAPPAAGMQAANPTGGVQR